MQNYRLHLADSLGYTTVNCGNTRPTLENFIDQGAGHEERYWAARVNLPLRFLLGKSKTSDKN